MCVNALVVLAVGIFQPRAPCRAVRVAFACDNTCSYRSRLYQRTFVIPRLERASWQAGWRTSERPNERSKRQRVCLCASRKASRHQRPLAGLLANSQVANLPARSALAADGSVDAGDGAGSSQKQTNEIASLATAAVHAVCCFCRRPVYFYIKEKKTART